MSTAIGMPLCKSTATLTNCDKSSDFLTREMCGSGIDFTLIPAGDIYETRDENELSLILRQSKAFCRKLGPCIVFRFHDHTGKLISDYARVKPKTPPKWGDKPPKYLSPRGVPNRVYFPNAKILHEAIADPKAELLITEGEKKAWAACQAGFACIGLVGVWGWCRKRAKDADGQKIGPRELLADLTAVSWAGRRVVIIFDSDAAENRQVQGAERALAEALIQWGAGVRNAR